MTHDESPSRDGVKPEADREGDIDDDRQDPPKPPYTESSDQELDPFAATPGDDADDKD